MQSLLPSRRLAKIHQCARAPLPDIVNRFPRPPKLNECSSFLVSSHMCRHPYAFPPIYIHLRFNLFTYPLYVFPFSFLFFIIFPSFSVFHSSSRASSIEVWKVLRKISNMLDRLRELYVSIYGDEQEADKEQLWRRCRQEIR